MLQPNMWMQCPSLCGPSCCTCILYHAVAQHVDAVSSLCGPLVVHVYCHHAVAQHVDAVSQSLWPSCCTCILHHVVAQHVDAVSSLCGPLVVHIYCTMLQPNMWMQCLVSVALLLYIYIVPCCSPTRGCSVQSLWPSCCTCILHHAVAQHVDAVSSLCGPSCCTCILYHAVAQHVDAVSSLCGPLVVHVYCTMLLPNMWMQCLVSVGLLLYIYIVPCCSPTRGCSVQSLWPSCCTCILHHAVAQHVDAVSSLCGPLVVHVYCTMLQPNMWMQCLVSVALLLYIYIVPCCSPTCGCSVQSLWPSCCTYILYHAVAQHVDAVSSLCGPLVVHVYCTMLLPNMWMQCLVSVALLLYMYIAPCCSPTCGCSVQSLWPSCCTCILYHAVAQHVDAVSSLCGPLVVHLYCTMLKPNMWMQCLVSVALLLYMYIVPCCSPTCGCSVQSLWPSCCTCILHHAVAQHVDAVSSLCGPLVVHVYCTMLQPNMWMQCLVSVALLLYMYIVPCCSPTCGCSVQSLWPSCCTCILYHAVAQHVDAVSSLCGPSCCTCILYHAVAQHVDAVSSLCGPSCCTCILYHAVAQHVDAVSSFCGPLVLHVYCTMLQPYMWMQCLVSVALLLYIYIVPCCRPTRGCSVQSLWPSCCTCILHHAVAQHVDAVSSLCGPLVVHVYCTMLYPTCGCSVQSLWPSCCTFILYHAEAQHVDAVPSLCGPLVVHVYCTMLQPNMWMQCLVSVALLLYMYIAPCCSPTCGCSVQSLWPSCCTCILYHAEAQHVDAVSSLCGPLVVHVYCYHAVAQHVDAVSSFCGPLVLHVYCTILQAQHVDAGSSLCGPLAVHVYCTLLQPNMWMQCLVSVALLFYMYIVPCCSPTCGCSVQSLWPSCCTCILYHAVAQHVDAVSSLCGPLVVHVYCTMLQPNMWMQCLVSVALLLYMYIVPCCSPTCGCSVYSLWALLLYMYIVPCCSPTCGCSVYSLWPSCCTCILYHVVAQHVDAVSSLCGPLVVHVYCTMLQSNMWMQCLLSVASCCT